MKMTPEFTHCQTPIFARRTDLLRVMQGNMVLRPCLCLPFKVPFQSNESGLISTVRWKGMRKERHPFKKTKVIGLLSACQTMTLCCTTYMTQIEPLKRRLSRMGCADFCKLRSRKCNGCLPPEQSVSPVKRDSVTQRICQPGVTSA